MNKFGLTDGQMNLLKTLFLEAYISFTDVKVFGSRAMGTYRPYLDLVILGDTSTKKINRLRTLCEESSIPTKIDLCAYHSIKTSALKKYIDTFAKPLFL